MKNILYITMGTAKDQASICVVSPEPMLFTHASGGQLELDMWYCYEAGHAR